MADIQACFKSSVKHPLGNLLKNAYMRHFGQRIQERLDDLRGKVTVADIARAAGRSPQTVYQWISGDTKEAKPSNLLPTARLLGVHIDWLVNEKGPKLLSNTEIGPEVQGKVPILSWIQAGDFASVVDNYHPGQAEEWVETTVPIKRHTYALRVRGDSMTNPNGEPTFPHGQVIIVEPDAINSPENLIGAFVIIKRNGDEEATFKKLVRDGGKFWLRPLNPQYPMIEMLEGDVMCGVVREKNVRFF